MATKIVVAIIIVIVTTIGLYIFISPEAAGREPAKREFTISIHDGRIEGEVQKFTAHEGDTVVFKIRSDVADEFHLHGYDRSIDLIPGEQVSLTLNANASGRFVFELEESQIELGSLEVLP